MGLTRSGPSLDVLLAALDDWSDGTVAHDVAVGLAVEAQGLIRRGFDEGRAPDGSKWAPLKPQRDGRPWVSRRPLRKTDRLASWATVYIVDRDGFVFAGVPWAADYGKYHQSELPRTSNLPRRPFYPDAAGLSTGWSIVLSEAADEAAREHLPR
ncbi:MAG: hypothetical protein Q8S73_42990 [Deltaproteobacteria bacterium]|nr:hypothetical protein [Myxococcales bacterium]MDP3220929.1 hypothetical protein [Deltaproteobacteria bacterium]